MTQSKVTPGVVTSMTRLYSNTEDDSRLFDISCEVIVNKGVLSSFKDGYVRQRDSQPVCCSFSASGDLKDYCNFNFNGIESDKAREIVKVLMDFFEDVRSEVENNLN